MARLHPGVYVEEVASGVRPIEGVGTSTAAFIGKTQMGTLNKAVLITNPQSFETNYGGFLVGFFLAHSVRQFFNNGGKSCYIVRIAGTGVAAAAIALKDRKDTPATPAKTLTISAVNEGEWGNRLDVVIKDSQEDPDNEFDMEVWRDRSDANPPLPPLLLETHNNLSMNSADGRYVESALVADSKFIRAKVEAANVGTAKAGVSRSGQLPVGNGADDLKLVAPIAAETGGTAGPPSTPGTSRSGVNPSINPPADKRKFKINLDGDGEQEVAIPPDPATGNDIAAAIQRAVIALTPTVPANQPAYTGFKCIYDTTVAASNPSYLFTSGTTGTTSSVVVKNSSAQPISLPSGAGNKFTIEIDGDGPHVVALTLPLVGGLAIKNAIELAVQGLTPKRSANKAAFLSFTCAYDTAAAPGNPSLVLTSGTPLGVNRARSSVRVTDASSAAENAAGLLKLGLTNGGREIKGSAILRPANSNVIATEYHLGDAVVSGNIDSVVFGQDGGTPGSQEHIDGLSALDTVNDVNIVTIPGISDQAVVGEGVNYCTQRGDCFFIADVHNTDDTVEEARTFMNSLTVKSSYGALYYPWLRMIDPTGRSPEPIQVPTCGFVAGMYARIDARRGVWKAPAGTEANLGGAVGVVADTTDEDQDFLNPAGVNVLRSFPASGLVIWGARTLATRSDPEYRYVPVRRTAIFLEQSIYNGIQWAVFEPNDDDLWASLRLNISSFMFLQFRAGAFQGKTATDAFFVKCDGETTTQADIDAGIVNILVGFAPLKPAEFVVLKLTQKAGQPPA